MCFLQLVMIKMTTRPMNIGVKQKSPTRTMPMLCWTWDVGGEGLGIYQQSSNISSRQQAVGSRQEQQQKQQSSRPVAKRGMGRSQVSWRAHDLVAAICRERDGAAVGIQRRERLDVVLYRGKV